MSERKKTYSLADLGELSEELKKQEIITVNDRDTGITKEVKTVDRAEICCVTAYMLGISSEKLEEYYSHHYADRLEELRGSRDATIIRCLSHIRTTVMLHFIPIDNRIRYSLENLDTMEYFDREEFSALSGFGINVIQPNYRAEKYVLLLTRLIDENIDACCHYFPDSIKFEYIRQLFVPPKYQKRDTLAAEYNKYHANINIYPFQAYICWQPEACGYLLYSDTRFLTTIYRQHGEEFYEGYKFRDACDCTKDTIYSLVHESAGTVIAVDCENANPYKLFAVLKNLNSEDMEKTRIVLYDDYHTSIAWDYIGKLIKIPVEHIEIPRVVEQKSLVDIKMAVGVTSFYYRGLADSFILVSSDSDFWGLISSLPDARFLVLYEYSKCGEAIKEALDGRRIFHCSMDDFYTENARELQQTVLKKTLEAYLPHTVGENAWELTKKVFQEAYVEASEKEMKIFYENTMRKIKLKINENGNYEIVLPE